MSMEKMYTELILTHNRSGHNKHVLEGATHMERGHNPNCGDDLTLQLTVESNTVIDAAFIGNGCAISQASMSIMIDMVKGKKLSEAKTLTQNFLTMVRGGRISDDEMEQLQDAQIFENLSKMPARAKCGTLGWHCLEVILDNAN